MFRITINEDGFVVQANGKDISAAVEDLQVLTADSATGGPSVTLHMRQTIDVTMEDGNVFALPNTATMEAYLHAAVQALDWGALLQAHVASLDYDGQQLNETAISKELQRQLDARKGNHD